MYEIGKYIGFTVLIGFGLFIIWKNTFGKEKKKK